MKKRIFSFVIMLVTLIAVISFGIPTIKNNAKTGMEFNGGFDIYYEVNSEDRSMSNKELANTAAEGIEKRLDIANIIDPIVSVEGNKYVRVTVSASSQIVADDIRSVIENNAEISFRDFENNLLATGEEILEDVGATLSDETDINGYPIILLNIKDTELLAEITENVSSLSDTHLVVWLGYEEGDDYANLNTDASVAKKIIYNATVSEKLDTETITVTGSFTKSVAESTVALINSGTLDYDLEVLQISAIEADYAQNSFNKVLIASLVAMIIIVIFLSAYYKIGGLISAIILCFNTFLTLLLFITMKGIINQQAIAALIVAIGISVDAIIVLLERVNMELYNGKNLERALNEGYKKSVYSIVDANVVTLIASLVMFFFGQSVANFALMLSLSSVSSLIVMTLIYKFALTSTIKIVGKKESFGAKKVYLENKEVFLKRKSVDRNLLKNTKKYLLGCGGFAVVSIIIMLVFQLTIGALFNYNNTIEKNSTITIISTNEYFTDNEHIMQFFAEDDLNIELKNIESSKVEKDGVTKYRVSVKTKDSVTNKEKELTNKIISVFGENKEYDERYELYINDINPKSAAISLLSALYTVGIGILIIGAYLTIRYRYSYAIAAIVSSVATIVLTALFFGLTRIKVGSDGIISIFAITIYGLNTLIIIFNRLKEMIGNNGKKYISNEERYEAIRKTINVTLPRTILMSGVIITISLVLLSFASLTNYSFYLTLIVGLILSTINVIFVSSQIWLLFEKIRDNKKRKFKPKKKISKFKEFAEEHVFIGVND